ncbi:DUF6807 family protein [Nesterenkonia muleiensis]|uniref:DUF6807 family protein n=1 Tax=Nesterenkonia muleiensis TaxID=2282648 RepID=UPI000E71CFFE|nr:DUF6807 family protein [Nesterenkonia muleiensis]
MAFTAAAAPVRTPEVILIGLDGFGRQHLRNIARLTALQKVRLIAGVGFSDPGPEVRGEIPVYRTLAEACGAGHRPDIIIVSTPINTHFDLAIEALRMGADVLVEKPPTATLEQFQRLLTVAENCGRHVQVGFQSIGSHTLPAIEQLLSSGEIGQLRAVGATGLWLRTESYYARAPWAGRRTLEGVQVVDGVVTNPLAHAVKTALHIAGAKHLSDVADLHTELHHAHRIEADDTSIVQLRTTAGIPVTAALTLCAAEQQDPWITISGTEGEAILYYTRDELVITPNPQRPGATEAQSLTFQRTDLLENLIEVQAGLTSRLLSPLEDHGAFMAVLESVRTAPKPAAIGAEHLLYGGKGTERHPIIPHVENYLARAVKAAPSSFSSLGAPWAAEPSTSGSLSAGTGARTAMVAQLRTGEDISPTDSPRPFLDAVTTLGGVVVTDQQPLDHTWHLGVGTALQDVNGHNFWGGRTYTRDAGRYVWRGDHGRITTVSQSISDHAHGQQLNQQLDWNAADGAAILTEKRTVSTYSVSPEHWTLSYSYELTPAGREPVSLGSPGANGREEGGYGGFFWRLPMLEDASIFTAEAEGEEEAHGSMTEWLAITGHYAPLPSRYGSSGPATLLLKRQEGNPDPWFVRHRSYPGVGMSLAWEQPVVLQPGETAARQVQVLVVDGVLTPQHAAELIGTSL